MNLDILLYKVFTGQVLYGLKERLEKYKGELLNEELKRFHILISEHKYSDAAELGEQIYIKLNFNYNVLRETAICFYLAGDPKMSDKLMIEYLDNKGISVGEITALIKKKYSNNSISNLKYHFYGGFANLGFISFELDGIEYIGKILKNSPSTKRELYFYEKILGNLNLNENIPDYLGALIIKNVVLLITKKITGEKPKKSFDERYFYIIRELISHSIREFGIYKNKKFFYPGNSEAGKLQKKIANKYIIANMRKNVLDAKAVDILPLVDYYEKIIVENRLYRLVSIKAHYGFAHNDFHRNNMLCNEKEAYILDWSNYIFALKGWDLAYYIGNFEVEFKVLRNYIETIFAPKDDKNSIVGRIFLTYMISYVWSARLHGEYRNELFDLYFNPAKKYVEELYLLLHPNSF